MARPLRDWRDTGAAKRGQGVLSVIVPLLALVFQYYPETKEHSNEITFYRPRGYAHALGTYTGAKTAE